MGPPLLPESLLTNCHPIMRTTGKGSFVGIEPHSTSTFVHVSQAVGRDSGVGLIAALQTLACSKGVLVIFPNSELNYIISPTFIDMTELPKTLEDAIAQACAATEAALADACKRLQIELLFPELKLMPVARQLLPIFAPYGDKLKVFFADAGSAALARRDWTDVPFKIFDIGTGRAAVSIQSKIQPEDEIFLFIAPTSVEMPQLEKICQEIGDRPFVMLNPFLEDAGKIGIGYAARQTRERFLNTIESCYYLRPVYQQAALFRCYPGAWEVWVQTNGDYQKIAELPHKPSGDELDMILTTGQAQTKAETVAAKKTSLFRGLQRFLKALRN